MNSYIKRITNYFLIGILAFIPIVVVLQIVLFMKELISTTFEFVYGGLGDVGINRIYISSTLFVT
jgi:uncharacterized membrane protein